MSTFLPDTSCMIAAVCAWHEHHAPARAEIENRLDGGDIMIAAAPALVEAYAVLTRLPFPHRLFPKDALALLESNFMGTVRVVVLDGRAYQSLLRRAPQEMIGGGRIYDAVIAECASKGGADVLLTFNDSDFSGLNEKLRVVVPGKSSE